MVPPSKVEETISQRIMNDNSAEIIVTRNGETSIHATISRQINVAEVVTEALGKSRCDLFDDVKRQIKISHSVVLRENLFTDACQIVSLQVQIRDVNQRVECPWCDVSNEVCDHDQRLDCGGSEKSVFFDFLYSIVSQVQVPKVWLVGKRAVKDSNDVISLKINFSEVCVVGEADRLQLTVIYLQYAEVIERCKHLLDNEGRI